MIGLIQASETLLPDSSCCCQFMVSAPHPIFCLWGGIFYATGIFSGLCHLVQIVENISLLEEVWNWIHLHEVNRFLFLLVAENFHLFSLHQTIMENVLDISNDTSTYSLHEFRRGGGACCSNWLSWRHAVRSGVGAVSSCGTLGSAPASILPNLPRPGLPALEPGRFCPTPDCSRALSLV